MTKYIKVLDWEFGGVFNPYKNLILVNFDYGVLRAFLTYHHELYHKIIYDVKHQISNPYCKDLPIYRLLDFLFDAINHTPF